MAIVLALVIVGWLSAILLGSQSYAYGEQAKPSPERNWRSESFGKLAQTVTGRDSDFGKRTPAYSYDVFSSQALNQ